MVLASNRSWFPVGESFLAAQGIRLTREELALPPGPPSRETFWERLLSGGDYALRLAAQSSECPAGSPPSPGEAGAGIYSVGLCCLSFPGCWVPGKAEVVVLWEGPRCCGRGRAGMCTTLEGAP